MNLAAKKKNKASSQIPCFHIKTVECIWYAQSAKLSQR